MAPPVLMLLALWGYGEPLSKHDAATKSRLDGAQEVATAIDRRFAEHWAAQEIHPAAEVDDAGFLRRLSLDLIGRIPTRAETAVFAAATGATPEKRIAAIDRLLHGPEFPLYWSAVLDEMIQGRFAGDREFAAYLRSSLEADKPWDRLFAEMMVGPWEDKEQAAAAQFLRKRLQSIDDLTNDSSRVFFGVEVGCAKCHDHPLVKDWKQQHYYGLQSFFNRTHEAKGKEKSNERLLAEKDSGDVQFVDTSGQQHTAARMFLTGQVVADVRLDLDPKLQDRRKAAEKNGRTLPPAFSPRAELVRVALEERKFLSRAFANRVWAQLIGRGLVHPIEQMHSANPPSVPGALETLAEDIAEHGYDVKRLIGAIVSSRVYQLSSQSDQTAAIEDKQSLGPEDFAVAPLRPLSPLQYALSATVACGETTLDDAYAAEDRERIAKLHRELEDRSRGLTTLLDPRRDEYQTSTNEALFMSNGDAVQKLLTPQGKNLMARLAAANRGEIVDLVVETAFSRPPLADEREMLETWLASREQDKAAACRDLAWALLTSAEFRFNH